MCLKVENVLKFVQRIIICFYRLSLTHKPLVITANGSDRNTQTECNQRETSICRQAAYNNI